VDAAAAGGCAAPGWRDGAARADFDVSMVTMCIPMVLISWLERAMRGVFVCAQEGR